MNLSKVQVKPIKKEVELLGNFEETNLGYTTLELAKEEAERCLHCPHAPCMKACQLIIIFLILLNKSKIEMA